MSLVSLTEDGRHGVFHVTGECGGLQDEARTAGWSVVALDTTQATDKQSFMDAVADAFDLPAWFGRNWDALDECLRALDLDEPEGLLVVWDGWAPFAEADPDAFETSVEVFQDACVAWADDDVAGAVLLRGAGPETDLATIDA